MEEYTQTEGEVHLEPERENRSSEQPEVQPVTKQQRKKGKEKQQEVEEDEFISEEAFSVWKKHYAGKGFVGERGFSQLISPFKELIEQRGWEEFCKHQKSGYAAVIREFYSNLVGRKENSVYVRGVWVPYGAKTINEMYGMEGQKNGSKFKKLMNNLNREKIARKLTEGKGQWKKGKGEQKTLSRGDLTEEAKVWFYFLASVMVPTKHVCTVREQKAILLYAILKGYKIDAGTVIENSIMRYHEGNKRGLIPHPATITRLCLRAGVKGTWEEEEECLKMSPLTLTGVRKGPRNQRKKVGIIEADSRKENDNIRQEEDTLLVEDQEEEDPEAHPKENTFIFADDREQGYGIPIDFSTPLASSPPIRNSDFREPGESSRGAQENNQIMEILNSIQKSMEEREEQWNLQQKFIEEVYEKELKRRDQQWEEEMNKREEVYEAEMKRRDQQWEE